MKRKDNTTNCPSAAYYTCITRQSEVFWRLRPTKLWTKYITVFLDVTECNLVDSNVSYKLPACVFSNFYHEDGASRFLRNVTTYQTIFVFQKIVIIIFTAVRTSNLLRRRGKLVHMTWVSRTWQNAWDKTSAQDPLSNSERICMCFEIAQMK
jgi:hypothetical protein